MRIVFAAGVVGLIVCCSAFQRADRPRDRESDRRPQQPAYTAEQAQSWLDRAHRRDDHIVRQFEIVQREAADYRALAIALDPIDNDVAGALEDIAEALEDQAEALDELIEELRDD